MAGWTKRLRLWFPVAGTFAGVDGLADSVDRLAADTGFSGVVRVDLAGEPLLANAYGTANRAHDVPMTVDTQLGIASGAKGLTAL
ncbi:MAG: hypothetical protein QOI82_1796, partial [Actinomycetota bacterium]|nr:hypothetical protein [Actinomycetota bacterium]